MTDWALNSWIYFLPTAWPNVLQNRLDLKKKKNIAVLLVKPSKNIQGKKKIPLGKNKWCTLSEKRCTPLHVPGWVLNVLWWSLKILFGFFFAYHYISTYFFRTTILSLIVFYYYYFWWFNVFTFTQNLSLLLCYLLF